MMDKDKASLCEQLSKILGWDQMILEGIVDTIAQPSTSQQEVDELVQVCQAKNAVWPDQRLLGDMQMIQESC